MSKTTNEYFRFCAGVADDTDVLMQVGKFYELYEAGGAGTATKVAQLLGLQLTRKDKTGDKEVCAANPLMAGFPCSALMKYARALVAAGRTVVVVNERKQPDGSCVREIERTFSVSTLLDAGGDAQHVQCHVVWEDYVHCTSVGACSVDLASGRVRLFETHGAADVAVDAAVLWLQRAHACEVFFRVRSRKAHSADALRALFKLRGCAAVHVQEYAELSPQVVNHIVAEAYPQFAHGMLTATEYVGIERNAHAAHALARALELLRKYHPSNVANLEEPRLTDGNGVLTLERDVLAQLSLVGDDGVLQLLDRCSTRMGSEYLRDALTHPMTDAHRIRAVQDEIAFYVAHEDEVARIRGELSRVGNARLMLRKLGLGTLKHAELDAFCAWTRNMLAVHAEAAVALFLQDAERVTTRDDGTGDAMTCVRGVSSELDDRWDAFGAALADATALINRLRAMNGLAQGVVRLLRGTHEGYTLNVSRRAKTFVGAETLPAKSGMTLRNDNIAQLCEVLNACHDDIERLSKDALATWCRASYEAYGGAIKSMLDGVARKDALSSHATRCKELRLERPHVTPAAQASGLCARGLRHPLVESRSDVRFTPADVALGYEHDGILLHGINSSGKSTLIKSIGIAVVMAQAGLYVACDHMTLMPFEHLASQVDFHDDICRGSSSFVIEMQGLKAMLRGASPRTLLLADELTRGTEARSAASLFCAAVKRFQDLGARFVMSSHLTELDDGLNACRADMSRVRTCHFAHELDDDGELVFTRALKDGRGPLEYGVTVCETILRDREFSRYAREVLATRGPRPASAARTSRYNGAKSLLMCQVCGGAAQETHHIAPQKDADEDGRLPDGRNVHALHNLVSLCHACHAGVHSGRVHIKGYVQGSRGTVLRVVQ